MKKGRQIHLALSGRATDSIPVGWKNALFKRVVMLRRGRRKISDVLTLEEKKEKEQADRIFGKNHDVCGNGRKLLESRKSQTKGCEVPRIDTGRRYFPSPWSGAVLESGQFQSQLGQNAPAAKGAGYSQDRRECPQAYPNLMPPRWQSVSTSGAPWRDNIGARATLPFRAQSGNLLGEDQFYQTRERRNLSWIRHHGL